MKSLPVLLLLIAAPAHAQEAKSVPQHSKYIEFCMTLAEQSEDGGAFASSIDRGFAKATCECKFQHFPKRKEMTQNEFVNAVTVCAREEAADSLAFVQKYLK